MENARISLFQLFTLLVFFIVGTTVMFPLASDAKQAAWVAVLFAMLGGIALFELYQYLYRQYPDLLFADYTKRILGKYVGTIIGISYTVFFLYGAARDVRDGMELLSLKFSETPITFLGGLLILVIMYGLYMGIEVISRCSEILFVILLGMGILFAVFVFVSGIVKLENLLPILEPGWKTIISTAMKESWMAPFGEVVCFTVIFPYLNRANGQLRVGLGGVIAGGLFLAFAHALTIAVIGSRARDNAISPLLKMVQQVNVGDFIQRLDSFFMIWLIINDFFKITIFMYAAVMCGTTLLKISKNVLILPMGAVVLCTSIFFADSYAAHMEQSDFVLKNIYPIFGAYIPVLLCVVLYIRRKFGEY